MLTIRSSGEIDRLFKTGTRAADPLLVALAHQSGERGRSGRVAFVAGRAVGSAVLRNRAKRRLREATRTTGGPWPEWDVALIARPKILDAKPGEVERALMRVLGRLGISHG